MWFFIYRGFGNKYSKGNRFSNPFVLVAISGTELPKGLSLVQQNNSATQNNNIQGKKVNLPLNANEQPQSLLMKTKTYHYKKRTLLLIQISWIFFYIPLKSSFWRQNFVFVWFFGILAIVPPFPNSLLCDTAKSTVVKIVSFCSNIDSKSSNNIFNIIEIFNKFKIFNWNAKFKLYINFCIKFKTQIAWIKK